MSMITPFGDLETKPQVLRMPDGRVAIFMGAAYQVTSEAGALSLRNNITALLTPPPLPPIDPAAEHALVASLAAELHERKTA